LTCRALALGVAGAVMASAALAAPVSRTSKGHFVMLYDISAEILETEAFLDLIEQKNRDNADLTDADIAARDAAWRAGDAEILDPVLDNILSKRLAEIAEAAGGQFAEIVVMDDKGRNVAVSTATDDYWQGDEDKFTKTFALEGDDTYYSGDVFFDEFRGILAQQLAKPIKRRGRRIGALSFEVNIEYVAN